MTRLRVCAALAALYTLALLLTGCHDAPATYTAPTSTWENQ
ncbi:hypothetical protein [Rhodococcus sp. 2G]|nr:hypothetical protein [Rhodococcus sp. 2G]